MNILKQIEQGESKTIEFKEQMPNSAEYMPNNAEYDRIRPNTTDNDRIVIAYIKKNSAVNRSEAKVLLGIGETKIKEIFNALIEKDLIRRVGAGRSTHYILREHFDGEEG